MLKSVSICLFIAISAALFVTGCGGGGSDDPQISKAEFIKQGNAICTKAREKRTADFGAEPTLTTEEIVTKLTLPSIREIAGQLDELGAPAGDEAKVDAIVTGIEKGVDKSERLIKKYPEGFEVFVASAEKLALEYGLKDCVEVL